MGEKERDGGSGGYGKVLMGVLLMSMVGMMSGLMLVEGLVGVFGGRDEMMG